ncbi:hypothetical protein DES34_11051 [Brevibacillus brevis]|nr:hypothetical protein DES34_11051 [Brevibacillus brevis]VEF91216.1 Uncharacterised protein [Brevibacillus brevis]
MMMIAMNLKPAFIDRLVDVSTEYSSASWVDEFQ